MEKLQKVVKRKDVLWVSFDSPKKCKAHLIKLASLGYRWFNGKKISPNEKLDFYFTLEVDEKRKTVGFVSAFQRFAKTLNKG